MLVAAPLTVIAPAGAATNQRLDLRLLVVSDGGFTVEALAAAMTAEGVPFTKINMGDSNRPHLNDPGFLSDTLGDGTPHGKFQAIVLPNSNPFGWPSAEYDAMVAYEAAFGVRQVDGTVFPDASVGLTTTGGWSGPLDGLPATVSSEALAGPFSYLVGSMHFDDHDAAVSESFGYLAVPVPGDGETFTPFLTGPIPGGGTGTLIGEFTGADGRQQLAITFFANQYQTYFRALTHGIITWATRGVHLGHSRSYLTVQVDDVFAFDSRWSADNNCTPGEDCPVGVTTQDIRMTPGDVTYAVNWQRANNFQLVFAYNGEESVRYKEDHNGHDPLTDALLANKGEFYWLNHTYSHEFLSCTKVFQTATGTTGGVSGDTNGAVPWECLKDAAGKIIWVGQDVIESEIQQNIDFANANGVPINPIELLTGEHSGLFSLPQIPTDNPNFVAAVNHLGIKATGADASRDPVTRQVGGASTFPRHPMPLWFNVSTKADEVDEYNWIYNSRANGGSGFCEDHPTISTCIAPLNPATGFDHHILPTEVRFDLMDMLTNDPRPLYVHQPNLTGDRLLYPVLDELLRQYRSLYNGSAPFVQPSVTDLTNVMADQKAWANGGSDAVEAYLLNGQVVVNSPAGARDVPITVPEGTRVDTSAGPLFGETYAGERSAWTSVGAAPLVLALLGTVAQAASQTTLTSSANPSAVDQAVTFTATVASSIGGTIAPTGTVEFQVDGANSDAPVTLVNGVATFTTSTLTANNHTISAVYSGDGLYSTSTDTLNQGVMPVVNAITPPITPSVSPPAPSPVIPGVGSLGYWMLQDDGTVYGFGAALAGDPIGRPSVAIDHAPRGGYWVLAADGTVHGRNGAPQHAAAATAELAPGEHAAALSGLPDGSGYWIFTNRGRAIPFGAAEHFGDMSAIPLNGPVVASVATPTGHGYYMIASDGGVFAFGDAAFHGSTGNLRLNQPVVGIAPDPDGAGYWLVAADGGIFAFDATFRGSMGATPLNQAVIGAVAYGNGYLMVASDGGIFSFSDLEFLGSLGNTPPATPIVDVTVVQG
jgi:hypothetical protein